MKDFIKKITSRKFILAVAAFLASIGLSITGLSTGDQKLATFGMACTIVSAAIYQATEAYVDGASVKSSTTSSITTNTTVQKNDTTTPQA